MKKLFIILFFLACIQCQAQTTAQQLATLKATLATVNTLIAVKADYDAQQDSRVTNVEKLVIQPINTRVYSLEYRDSVTNLKLAALENKIAALQVEGLSADQFIKINGAIELKNYAAIIAENAALRKEIEALKTRLANIKIVL